jgi:hypothetical protein
MRLGNTTMKFLVSTIFLLMSLPLFAAQPGQVMLFGTFHFQDAGLDVVKSEDVDIFTAEAQEYLQGLTQRLQGYKPTRVLLEYSPENDELINERYRQYLEGTYELPANEIYQMGFRIAKQAGHERVYSFDNRDVEWEAEALFEYAEQHKPPEMDTFNQIIKSIGEERKEDRATMSLGDLLRHENDPETERNNMDLYLVTNPIGAGDGYSGAVASSSWWKRNFFMYANIQKLAAPGERVIAIGGTGHMAILKQLLAIDGQLEGVAVNSYF